MPAIANVVINDGQTTPVAHTFQPAKSTADYSMYEDRILGQYIAFPRLHLTMVRPSGGESKVANRDLKVVCLLDVPELETLGNSDSGLTPAPTVAYRGKVKVEFTLPMRATAQQRKNLRAYMVNALQNAVLVDAVDNLSMPW